jgi:hypothetical protein
MYSITREKETTQKKQARISSILRRILFFLDAHPSAFTAMTLSRRVAFTQNMLEIPFIYTITKNQLMTQQRPTVKRPAQASWRGGEQQATSTYSTKDELFET